MWPNPQETVDLVTFTEKYLMENFCALQGSFLKEMLHCQSLCTLN